MTTSQNNNPEPWLRKRELADYIRKSTRWIEQKHHEGLPSVMIGGERRYKPSAVERWLFGLGEA
jgi:hypothetical protein